MSRRTSATKISASPQPDLNPQRKASSLNTPIHSTNAAPKRLSAHNVVIPSSIIQNSVVRGTPTSGAVTPRGSKPSSFDAEYKMLEEEEKRVCFIVTDFLIVA